MVVTNIRTATTILLIALTANGSCRSDPGHDEQAASGETAAAMFPDGLVHDFGKVKAGTQAKHTFRIVNTSCIPLRVVSLRFAG
jgi:hypothetical protein